MDPYNDFKVDNFYSNKKDQYTFFLTHMHEGIYFHNLIRIDHLGGLSRSEYGGSYSVPDQSWCWGTIYTSVASKKMLLLRFPHLAEYVHTLEL